MDSNGTNPLDLALAPNPSGAPPNFIDPPSLESAFLGVGISLMAISSILVIIRIYTNYQHTGKLYIDDYLCLAGWASSIIYWAFFKTLVDMGTARHVWDIPASIITPSYARRLLIQQIFGNIAMWAVKACIQALFIRIFESVRWMRIASYLLMISTGILYVAAIIIWCIYCTPRANEDWGTSAGVVGLLVDILMFAMPFPIILRLQLRTPKKVGLCLVFAVAFCTVLSACASLAYRIIAFRGARGDLTWVGMNVFITT
ncbi:hypothetical protein IQ07DRAFT_685134 [Pyrenochaeta sp. DS3sAY3a]|nr:hypothetical protein IQ07DRAFT_685134 [Pyrenochaeta sp. DS3sAY3a]